MISAACGPSPVWAGQDPKAVADKASALKEEAKAEERLDQKPIEIKPAAPSFNKAEPKTAGFKAEEKSSSPTTPF